MLSRVPSAPYSVLIVQIKHAESHGKEGKEGMVKRGEEAEQGFLDESKSHLKQKAEQTVSQVQLIQAGKQ